MTACTGAEIAVIAVIAVTRHSPQQSPTTDTNNMYGYAIPHIITTRYVNKHLSARRRQSNHARLVGTKSQRGYQMGISGHDKPESFTPSTLPMSSLEPRAASGQSRRVMAAEHDRKLAFYKESQRFRTTRLAGPKSAHTRQGCIPRTRNAPPSSATLFFWTTPTRWLPAAWRSRPAPHG